MLARPVDDVLLLRVATVFGCMRYRRSPQPKLGRMIRSPGSVSRMMRMDSTTFSVPAA